MFTPGLPLPCHHVRFDDQLTLERAQGDDRVSATKSSARKAFYGRYPAPFNPLETITPPSFNTLLSGGNVMHAPVSGESDHLARYQA